MIADSDRMISGSQSGILHPVCRGFPLRAVRIYSLYAHSLQRYFLSGYILQFIGRRKHMQWYRSFPFYCNIVFCRHPKRELPCDIYGILFSDVHNTGVKTPSIIGLHFFSLHRNRDIRQGHTLKRHIPVTGSRERLINANRNHRYRPVGCLNTVNTICSWQHKRTLCVVIACRTHFAEHGSINLNTLGTQYTQYIDIPCHMHIFHCKESIFPDIQIPIVNIIIYWFRIRNIKYIAQSLGDIRIRHYLKSLCRHI